LSKRVVGREPLLSKKNMAAQSIILERFLEQYIFDRPKTKVEMFSISTKNL